MRRFAKIKAQSEAAKSWVIEIAYAYGSDVRIIDEQGLEFEPISLSAFNTNYEVSTKEILRQGHYLQNLGMTIVMSRSTWQPCRCRTLVISGGCMYSLSLALLQL